MEYEARLLLGSSLADHFGLQAGGAGGDGEEGGGAGA